MIAVIADDLTGAAELAAVGWRHGLRAEVVLGNSDLHLKAIGEGTPAEAGPANLVCVDTDSRSCPAAEAEERAATATKALLAAGAEWVFKKVDSVLRGNVAPEVTAMMRETDAPVALLVPANPSLGRVIRGGYYFVHGQPLHETEFARDPGHPRRSSSVLELLEPKSPGQIRSCRAGEPLPTRGIVVGDVGSKSDLDAWAAQRRHSMLLAGGAEFFGAVLAASGSVTRPTDATDAWSRGAAAHVIPPLASASSKVMMHPQLGPRTLFVCGSTSEACRRFVERATVLRVPVFGLPDSLAHGEISSPEDLQTIACEAGEALKKTGRALLAVGLPFLAEPARAQKLTSHLVTIAAAVLRRTVVGHVFAEGGATAVELARRMGWTRLRVTRELCPGVATMEVVPAMQLCFTVKPGSYIWPSGILLGG